MIKNECRILRAIDSENMPRLMEVHETNRQLIQVFEKFVGNSLNVGKGKKPDGKIAMDTIQKALELLAYFQEKNIVHRNITSKNILIYRNPITGDSSFKLVDSRYLESLN